MIFTLDLEDHRPDERAEVRFPALVESICDALDAAGVRGTVFVVGELVTSHPEVVASVAARGHEIGLHGARHVPLPEVGPRRFAAETAEARDRLEQAAGAPCRGYRAPIFSLVPDSAWAPELLTGCGFTWSSSVLPAANPLYGWPGAPTGPFRWPSGLVELPAPLIGPGRLAVPVGGTYLRLAPAPLVAWIRRRFADRPDAWLYLHPYDCDPDEPRWTVPEVGRLASRLLWWRRRGMLERVIRLCAGSRSTLGEIAGELASTVPVFDPGPARPGERA